MRALTIFSNLQHVLPLQQSTEGFGWCHQNPDHPKGLIDHSSSHPSGYNVNADRASIPDLNMYLPTKDVAPWNLDRQG